MSRKYNGREQNFTTQFLKWARYNKLSSFAFEAKVAIGKSLSFSAVKEHQIYALLQAKKVFCYKISDFDRMQKPFDGFCLSKADGFVVIYFHKRENKEFFMINITDFLTEKKTSSRKSLTEKDCQRIGRTCNLC